MHVSKREKDMTQPRSAAQDTGVKRPEVHCREKGVNPNLKPQKDTVK